jgi:aspartate-semialdehyde dehydrogenase
MALALKPIRDLCGIKRVVVSTYQSVSGAGTAAIEELSIQVLAMLNQKPIQSRTLPHQIAFNCIPQIGGFKEDGYTGEEHKIIAESRKLLQMPQLKISAMAVRVPTFSCHGESIHVECEKPFDIEEVRSVLRSQPGIILQDDPKNGIYPMGKTAENDKVEGATGRDAVYVGRVRRDLSVEWGLNLWVVSDNLRKGAALNGVQLGERILPGLL